MVTCIVVYEASSLTPPVRYRTYAPFGFGSNEPVLVAHHRSEVARPPPKPKLVPRGLAAPAAAPARAKLGTGAKLRSRSTPPALHGRAPVGPADRHPPSAAAAAAGAAAPAVGGGGGGGGTHARSTIAAAASTTGSVGGVRLPLPPVTAPDAPRTEQRAATRALSFIPVAPPPLVHALLPRIPARRPEPVEYVPPAREDLETVQAVQAAGGLAADGRDTQTGLFLHADVVTGLPRAVPEMARHGRTTTAAPAAAPAPVEETGRRPGRRGDTQVPEEHRAMFRYARHNRARELQEMFARGARPDITDEHGNTLLHIAAQNGHRKIVKICLRLGANINAQNHAGQTALHYAYVYGFDELAAYLKSKGADDTLRNMFGLTCYQGLSADPAADRAQRAADEAARSAEGGDEGGVAEA